MVLALEFVFVGESVFVPWWVFVVVAHRSRTEACTEVVNFSMSLRIELLRF